MKWTHKPRGKEIKMESQDKKENNNKYSSSRYAVLRKNKKY